MNLYLCTARNGNPCSVCLRMLQTHVMGRASAELHARLARKPK